MFVLTDPNNINSRIILALKKFFGINDSRSHLICERLGISPWSKCGDLPDKLLQRIVNLLDKDFVIEQKLKFKVSESIRRINLIKVYRADRLRRGLPARGQRTRSNGKTVTRMQKKGSFKF